MISNGITKVFHGSWVIIKLNLFFWCLSLCGLLVLGVGPALQMISDLYQESGMDYQEITFKKAFASWKRNFKRSNISFWLFLFVEGGLLYNLYLSTQLLGLVWMMIDFLLITVSILLVIGYQYVIIYESQYEMPQKELLKLAFISIFYHFGTFWKMIFGLVSILVMTWSMKGLLIFATFSSITIWSIHASQVGRMAIAEKLTEYEG